MLRTGGGALAGAATAILLFRPGRPLARGLTVGLWTGAGLGSAYEHCNERFIALQAVNAPSATPAAAAGVEERRGAEAK